MEFKREWDDTCPRVWDTWEAKGRTWVVQDLNPEDDEKAVQMMINHFTADEPLCSYNGIKDDQDSLKHFIKFWKYCLSQRTTIACYTIVNGENTLVGFNICRVQYKDEHHEGKLTRENWKNFIGAIMYVEKKKDEFEYLGVDRVLTGYGLIVLPEYRGASIGGKIINAREALSKVLGVTASATIFTSPASQKLAAKCGFVTIAEATWSDFADAGLNYPRTDNCIKLMAKKYK